MQRKTSSPAFLFARAGAPLALAVILAACGAASPAASPSPSAPLVTITGAEAHARVAGGAVLLDVTPTVRADQSYIEGRTNIPYDELEGRLDELPRGRMIIVYCRSGRASPESTRLLRAHGFDARLLGARAAWDTPAQEGAVSLAARE